MGDEQLIVIFGALHLIALFMGCGLLLLFLRSEPRDEWPGAGGEEGSGGDGGSRLRPRGPEGSRPSGGIPLPDATQAAARMRGPGRLADAHSRQRRSLPEPVRSPAPALPHR